MIRKCVFTFLLVVSLSLAASRVHAANGSEIVAVEGSTPTIDGDLFTGEWTDADSILFNNTVVYAKQDGENLYIAVSQAYPMVAEPNVTILIDVDHDGSASLQSDDIALWIYRNGTVGEANVTAGAWTTTQVSGWHAESGTEEFSWQAEFNITYAKITIIAGVEQTIGIAFLRTGGAGQDVYTWPPNYWDVIENPSNWGDMTSTGHNWIPEFPSLLILHLLMTATLLVTTLYRRKKN
jgi:hypothetical protein